MAKTKISEYDSIASNNTDIDGVNISEGCSPANINNALREQMAHLKDLQAGLSGDTIPVASGGTGSTTASGARTNLGLGALATLATVDTAQIAADAVDGTKIADDSIDSEHYVDGSIDTVHIADDAVTSAKIAANAVDATALNVSGDGTAGQALTSDGDGSFSWGGGGKILQVVTSTVTAASAQTVTAKTWTQLTALNATITPTSSSSKILIMVNFGKQTSNGNIHAMQVRRGTSTIVTQGDSNGSRIRETFNRSRQGEDVNQASGFSFSLIDTPATTSATTYYLYMYLEGTIFYLNRAETYGDNDASYNGTSTSNIILMEIAG